MKKVTEDEENTKEDWDALTEVVEKVAESNGIKGAKFDRKNFSRTSDKKKKSNFKDAEISNDELKKRKEKYKKTKAKKILKKKPTIRTKPIARSKFAKKAKEQ